ncbi:MAG TPA: hypothetical protein VEU32_11705 [Burkholderiales bacterium]|nr:hypothetical protein [Burkholderiales bacterium]
MSALASDGQTIEHLKQRSPLRFTTTGDQQRTFLSENRGQRLVDPERGMGETGLVRLAFLAPAGYCVKHSATSLAGVCDRII